MLKKMLDKTRKKLIRLVFLEKIEKTSTELCLSFKLKNFLPFKKKLRLNIKSANITHNEIITTSSKYLMIKIPIVLMHNAYDDVVIKLYINNKRVWITNNLQVLDRDGIFRFGKRLFTIEINRNLYFNSIIEEYQMEEDVYTYEEIVAGNNMFRLKIPSTSLTGLSKIYAVKTNNKVEVKYKYENDWLIVENLDQLHTGLWKLLVVNGNQGRFIEGIVKVNHLILDTKFNKVSFINNQSGFYLLISPHEFTCQGLNINRNKYKDALEFVIEKSNLKNAKYQLLMETIGNGKKHYYPMLLTEGKLIGNIPLKDIYKSFRRKRFFVICIGDNMIKQYRLHIPNKTLKGDSINMTTIILSQKIQIEFYIRKDRSLGLKMPSPKLNKEIYKIENNKLYGYLSNTDMFSNCTFYLVIEERYTKDKIEVQINNRFNIDLKSLPLAKIEKKQKTVLDFFVVVKSENGVQIRKEKIKFRYADYKKDAYYDSFSTVDGFGNKHYYLITTTPFDNLKVEYFLIPNTINIPEDTSKKDLNIWLIGERTDTAQENGFVFFKWMLKNTNIDVYYVIEECSDDYKKIKHIPNVLKFGSDKHFDIAFKAKVLLGTHDLENILPYKAAKGFFNYENTIKVFLQHGILGRKNVEYHKKYYVLPFDYFIVSSEPEKHQIVIDQMGYEEDEVLVTGLARFDNLYPNDVCNKDILIMPTWRDWLNTEEDFVNSRYYLNYKKLLTDKRLLKLLKENNMKVNFYPHYRAQSFFQRHLDINEEFIEFIKLGSESVQELLKSHKLLITDYSSVSFDFLFMQKPIIYFHFDEKKFFRRGILRPISETFLGEIGHTVEEVVNLIEKSISNNYKNNNADISGVIKHIDQNNSRRIYDRIQEKLDK